LQTGGTGANPSWGSVSSDYVKIASATPSNVQTVDIDNIFSTSDGYNSYEVIITNATPTDDTKNFEMRLINSSGSFALGGVYAWHSGGGELPNGTANFTQVGGTFSANEFRLIGQGGQVHNGTSGGGVNMTLHIINPEKFAYTTYHGHYSLMRSNGGGSVDNLMNMISAGVHRNQESIRGLRFFFSGGNINNAVITVYGRK